MRYVTITAVEIPDERVLEESKGKRLFESEKDGFLYFSIPYTYEHYVWGPSDRDQKDATPTEKYWVHGLQRYKVSIKDLKTEPNQSLQPTTTAVIPAAEQPVRQP